MKYFAEVVNGVVQKVHEADGVVQLPVLTNGEYVETFSFAKGNPDYDPSRKENSRMHFAREGYIYNAANDVFHQPQSFDSWTLDESTWEWKAPTPYPSDGEPYQWNEENKTWDSLKEIEPEPYDPSKDIIPSGVPQ